jgi:hypothetical protein
MMKTGQKWEHNLTNFPNINEGNKKKKAGSDGKQVGQGPSFCSVDPKSTFLGSSESGEKHPYHNEPNVLYEIPDKWNEFKIEFHDNNIDGIGPKGEEPGIEEPSSLTKTIANSFKAPQEKDKILIGGIEKLTEKVETKKEVEWAPKELQAIVKALCSTSLTEPKKRTQLTSDFNNYVIDKGVSPNVYVNAHHTLLGFAVQLGDINFIKLLFSKHHDIDINALDTGKNRTALDLVHANTKDERKSIVDFLVANGAKTAAELGQVNDVGRKLHSAVQMGDYATAFAIFRNKEMREVLEDRHIDTALAIARGTESPDKFKFVTLLTNAKVVIQLFHLAKCIVQETTHYGTELKSAEAFKELVSTHKISGNMYLGRFSVFGLAVRMNDQDLLELLIRQDRIIQLADPSQGRTASDIALTLYRKFKEKNNVIEAGKTKAIVSLLKDFNVHITKTGIEYELKKIKNLLETFYKETPKRVGGKLEIATQELDKLVEELKGNKVMPSLWDQCD